MNKDGLAVGSWVKIRKGGRAQITDLMPSEPFWIRLRTINDGIETAWNVAAIAPAPAPKLTREEQYQASTDVIRQSPAAYRVAGWLATHESNFHVSTPPKSLDDTKNLLDAHHVDYELGATLTVSTDATQGRSFSVVSDNHGDRDALFAETQVRSTTYQNNPNKISMQAREFVLDFLLDDLKFKLGKTQDVDAILARVPERFKEQFQTGMMYFSVDGCAAV